MKYQDLDGTPQEIKDLIELSGGDLKDFLQAPELPFSYRWIFIPVFIFLLDVFSIHFLPPSFNALLSLLGAALAVWIVVAVQLRLENWTASLFAAIGLIILLLLASDITNLLAVLKELLKIANKKE